MLSFSRRWAPLGLLFLGIQHSSGDVHRGYSTFLNDTTVYKPTTSDVTYIDTTTLFSATTVPVTHYVDVTVPYYVNVTKTNTVETCITESTTTTLHFTVSVTETDSATVTDTETTTETDSATITNTETDSATVTNTETTTATVPATITTYTTQTIISTTVDPCPTTCSLSVGTVNLFFWPTNRPYTYPSTWYDESLDYVFTSPSVYMLIPTAVGTNSLGLTGPSTSSWILPLDLDEVSTIYDGSVTRQLTLSDLGTDCPQTAEPSAIATMVDPACDPILAAPKQVSSWASPCNACGRFGLFDPPYAVPTLTGGLLGTTTATPAPVTTTAVVTPTSTVPVGTLLVIYYSDGHAMATATIPATGVSGTVVSSVAVSDTATTSSTSEVASTSAAATTTSSASSAATPATTPSTTPLTSTTPLATASFSASATTSVVTAAATRVSGGLAWLISSVFATVFLL